MNGRLSSTSQSDWRKWRSGACWRSTKRRTSRRATPAACVCGRTMRIRCVAAAIMRASCCCATAATAPTTCSVWGFEAEKSHSCSLFALFMVRGSGFAARAWRMQRARRNRLRSVWSVCSFHIPCFSLLSLSSVSQGVVWCSPEIGGRVEGVSSYFCLFLNTYAASTLS